MTLYKKRDKKVKIVWSVVTCSGEVCPIEEPALPWGEVAPREDPDGDVGPTLTIVAPETGVAPTPGVRGGGTEEGWRG